MPAVPCVRSTDWPTDRGRVPPRKDASVALADAIGAPPALISLKVPPSLAFQIVVSATMCGTTHAEPGESSSDFL